jgi:hypothetical protein
MAKLKPNKPRIVEAVLFLIEEADRHGRKLTQYEIVKSVFIADLWHLKKFGRPISFDNYVAMKLGPVPSETYDMLKADYHWGHDAPEGAPFWERAQPEGSRIAYFTAKRPANLKTLSQSDVGELREALTFVLAEGFEGVRDWTHRLQAYTQAWESRGDHSSNEMQYDLLLDQPDREFVADLIHASKHL